MIIYWSQRVENVDLLMCAYKKRVCVTSTFWELSLWTVQWAKVRFEFQLENRISCFILKKKGSPFNRQNTTQVDILNPMLKQAFWTNPILTKCTTKRRQQYGNTVHVHSLAWTALQSHAITLFVKLPKQRYFEKSAKSNLRTTILAHIKGFTTLSTNEGSSYLGSSF